MIHCVEEVSAGTGCNWSSQAWLSSARALASLPPTFMCGEGRGLRGVTPGTPVYTWPDYSYGASSKHVLSFNYGQHKYQLLLGYPTACPLRVVGIQQGARRKTFKGMETALCTSFYDDLPWKTGLAVVSAEANMLMGCCPWSVLPETLSCTVRSAYSVHSHKQGGQG